MSIAVACPACGGRFQAPDKAVGRQIPCPKCQTPILIPANYSAHGATTAPQEFATPHEEIPYADDQEPAPPRRRSRVAIGGSSALGDFLSFRRMIVPVIIQILFWFGVGVCVICGLIFLFRGFSGGGFLEILLVLAALLVGPVLVRCYCELLIVFFRINETLTDIKNELQRRPMS